MKKYSKAPPAFSKRERQIMDILYRLEKATARDVHESLPDAPSYTSVRSHLRAMLDKGYVDYRQQGVRYLYFPVVPKQNAKTSALRNVLSNFFGGSHKDLIATLIGDDEKNLSKADLDEISKLINQARKAGN